MIKKITTSLILFSLLFIVAFCPVAMFAAGSGQPANTDPGSPSSVEDSAFTIKNPLKAINVTELLTQLLDLVVEIGVVVVTCGFIYAGFLYATARGDKTQLGKAHTAISNTLIGAAILMGAFAITKVVQETAKQIIGSNDYQSNITRIL